MSAAESDGNRGSWFGVRGAIRLAFLAQIGVAVALAVGAIDEMRQTGWRPEVTTSPTAPALPGDQTRPYQPTTVPRRPDTAPGGPDIPWPEQMPKRLEVRTQQIDGFGETLMLTGPLDQGAADRVVAYLDALDAPPSQVALHSPGGVVAEALAIGRMVREREFDTLMTAEAACLSACPYILAGGVERRVSPEAWVGVHQSYYDHSTVLPVFLAVESIQRGEAEAMRYLQDMGVDPLVKLPALETPPDEIYILTPEELTEYRMATEMLD